jgi:hypothetical protein
MFDSIDLSPPTCKELRDEEKGGRRDAQEVREMRRREGGEMRRR